MFSLERDVLIQIFGSYMYESFEESLLIWRIISKNIDYSILQILLQIWPHLNHLVKEEAAIELELWNNEIRLCKTVKKKWWITGKMWLGHSYYVWGNRSAEGYPGWTWEEPGPGKVAQDLLGGGLRVPSASLTPGPLTHITESDSPRAIRSHL